MNEEDERAIVLSRKNFLRGSEFKLPEKLVFTKQRFLGVHGKTGFECRFSMHKSGDLMKGVQGLVVVHPVGGDILVGQFNVAPGTPDTFYLKYHWRKPKEHASGFEIFSSDPTQQTTLKTPMPDWQYVAMENFGRIISMKPFEAAEGFSKKERLLLEKCMARLRRAHGIA